MEDLFEIALKLLLHVLHTLPWLAGAAAIYALLAHEPVITFIALNVWLTLTVYLMLRYADRPLSKWFGESTAYKAMLFSFGFDFAALLPTEQWERIAAALVVKLALALFVVHRYRQRRDTRNAERT